MPSSTRAGLVTEGQGFVDLVGRVVSGLESLDETDRPVCWFLGGAAVLDLDDRRSAGARSAAGWPRRTGRIGANFERIRQTALDWRVLCPGPMVDQPPLGLARMRISLDRLPVQLPSVTRFAARGPGVAVVRPAHSRDDRLVCRRRGAHARQSHSRPARCLAVGSDWRCPSGCGARKHSGRPDRERPRGPPIKRGSTMRRA